MPLMTDLAKALLEQKSPDFAKYLSSLTESNFEAWLSNLATPFPWEPPNKSQSKQKAFNSARKFIAAHIRQSSSVYGSDTCSSAGSNDVINNLIRYCEKNQFNIISLNYDTLIEQHWRLMNPGKDPCSLYPFQIKHGAVDPKLEQEHIAGFCLFKLHGSVDWTLNGSEIVYWNDLQAKEGEISPNEAPTSFHQSALKTVFMNEKKS